jgi:hypothetical protein
LISSAEALAAEIGFIILLVLVLVLFFIIGVDDEDQ